MSFNELEADKLDFERDFLKGEDQGRRRIAIAMDKLDKSWDMIVRTTASVMAVMVASMKLEDRDLARDLLKGLLGLMQNMSDAWGIQISGLGNVPELESLKAEAQEVDAAGLAVAERVDLFGGAIMTQLLADVPFMWTKHYQQMSSVCTSLNDELSSDDAAYLARVITGKQGDLTRELIEMITDGISEGSSRMVTAGVWVERARLVFHSSLQVGHTVGTAMAQVISQCGFPDVCKED